MLTLTVEKRDTKTKPEAVRRGGKLPAVFYGRKEDSTSISVSQHDFEKVWREAGESTIISLEGIGDDKEALIQDVGVHPVSGKPLHADFYVIEKGKKLTVGIPLEFIGEAPAVKDLGGTLVKVIHELEIEALPKDLPQNIQVDISTLAEFDSQISVGDLKLSEGVMSLIGADETVAAVAEPKEEEVYEEPAEIDMDAIEAEGEKPAEDGAEKALRLTVSTLPIALARVAAVKCWPVNQSGGSLYSSWNCLAHFFSRPNIIAKGKSFSNRLIVCFLSLGAE